MRVSGQALGNNFSGDGGVACVIPIPDKTLMKARLVGAGLPAKVR